MNIPGGVVDHPTRAIRVVLSALGAAICLWVAVATPAPAVARTDLQGVEIPDGGSGTPANRVRAGGHGDLAPYEFVDDNGIPAGFNIDLLRAVGEAAGLDVEIRLEAWDKVLADFEARRLDLVIGMHATPERQSRYLFSTPYTDLPYDAFVYGDPSGIKSLNDLRGREVLVQGNSMGEALARQAGAVPVRVESPREAVRALSAGRAPFALIGRYPALWMAAQMGLEHVVPVGLDIPSYGYAFVTLPGREPLVEALNRGLADVKASGQYQAIWERWLGPLQAPHRAVWQILRYSAWVLGPIVLLLLLWGLWTRSLRREVRARTRQLEVELGVRRQAEAALAAEREQLDVTLRSIADAVVTVDRAGGIVLANGAAEALFGRGLDEVRGLPLATVLPLRDEVDGKPATIVERCLAGDSVAEMVRPAAVARAGGAARLVSGSAAAIRNPDGGVRGAVLVLRDVTEHRRMEEEMARSEKLESLGVLAGGIAHDFNNVLAAIVGNLSVARSVADRGSADEHLARAEEAARRARELTGQLLTFARGGAPVKRLVRPGQVIREAASFILSGSSSRVEVRGEADLWPAEVDSGQLTQVIHNLTLNAAQSMPGGGTVEIEATNVTLGAGNPAGLEPGPCIRIRVSDHGIGIPREQLSRIFEPFYTSTPGGTGLGLSISYSIVTRHGGWLGVESEAGRGTSFTVLLPARPDGRVEAPEPPRVERRGGGARVLVMDDDDLVRATLESQLEALGYVSVCTADGDEALEAYRAARSEGRPFAVAILDLTVPGAMGGSETLAKLRELDPAVAAVLATGYSGDPRAAEFERSGFAAVVPKPFTMRELSSALEKALQPRAPLGVEPAS